jgi:3-oxoacyl-[acyl-carrier protein] reductase
VAGALVAEGARVILVSRTKATLDRACAELGDRADCVLADLSHPPDIDRVAASTGALDGVLVNAGGPAIGHAFDLTDDQWSASFQLVVGGPIRLLRAVTPTLHDGGAILFVASSSVRQPVVGVDSSNVLRPGIGALVKTLARQLAPRLRVNAIAPGRFTTSRVRAIDEARAAADGVSTEERVRRMCAEIPLGRYGDPTEFGRVAVFLLSPAASYVTGTTVQVDGGYVSATP